MTEFLTLEAVLRLAERRHLGPIRDLGLLDSAVQRPRSSAFGQDAYPSMGEKAAALLQSIARNHALVDGNKRLAWFATVTFLALNGLDPQIGDDEAFMLVLDVATGLLEVPEIAKRLKVD